MCSLKEAAMAEMLCLQWDEFKQNTSSAFANFRGDPDLMDVTLACVDGQQMEAHRVILAASSPTFRNFFRRNKHPHPLIFMTETKSSDLSAILDFLYFGEANVQQTDLESFLAIADRLHLDGLMGATSDKRPHEQNVHQDGLISGPKPEQNVHQDRVIGPKREQNVDQGLTSSEENLKENESDSNGKSATKSISSDAKNKSDSTFKNVEKVEKRFDAKADVLTDSMKSTVVMQNKFNGALDLEIQAMMEMTRNRIRNGKVERHSYLCKICGKEGHGSNIKKHIERNHLEGLSVPCDYCEKKFKSRSALVQHKIANHPMNLYLKQQQLENSQSKSNPENLTSPLLAAIPALNPAT